MFVHVAYVGFKFGQRATYECHTPTRDCNYSGGALDKDDALCEIEHDVLFLDLGSDGHVWVSTHAGRRGASLDREDSG